MVSSVMSALILLPFLSVALHESGTRNALLGPWLNNTEVYLTPFISTQNHIIAGLNTCNIFIAWKVIEIINVIMLKNVLKILYTYNILIN